MSASNKTDLIIEITDTTDSSCEIDSSKIEQLIRFTCDKFALHAGRISIVFVNDEKISQIHLDFMDDSSTTDVISFDLSDEFDDFKTFEIVVNSDMARRQSQLRSNAFQAELALYVLHGLLHNLGFDDLTEPEFEKMHRTEDEVLTSLGYGSIYNPER